MHSKQAGDKANRRMKTIYSQNEDKTRTSITKLLKQCRKLKQNAKTNTKITTSRTTKDRDHNLQKKHKK